MEGKSFDILSTAILSILFLFITVFIALDIMNIKIIKIFEPIKDVLARLGFYGKQKQSDAINKQINHLIRKVSQ